MVEQVQGPEAEEMILTVIRQRRIACICCRLWRCVRTLDLNAGRLLKELDRLKMAEDTIVVFFTITVRTARWNGDMEGRKGSTEEGGTRSPLLVRRPSRSGPGTTIGEIASARDLLPTLTDLAGIEERPEKALDGKSLKPLLLGSGEQWNSRNLVSYWKDKIGVRGPRFRLGYKGGLFDMKKDPGQRTDAFQKFPKVKRVLEKKADHFRKTLCRNWGG